MPKYTTPPATAGDESTVCPTAAVQSGRQDRLTVEQLVAPAASKAERTPSVETVYTLPPVTAGAVRSNPVDAVQRGVHVVGVPEHPSTPAASKANRCPSYDVMKTTPSPTTGVDGLSTPPVYAVHNGVQVVAQ